MRKPRITYKVYMNGRFIGETFAVSEKQAINNVRHNYRGDFESQYDNDWEAEPKYPEHGGEYDE